jgi:hypothetical protein
MNVGEGDDQLWQNFGALAAVVRDMPTEARRAMLAAAGFDSNTEEADDLLAVILSAKLRQRGV